MKVLSANAGYLLGYQTVAGGYVPSPTGALFGDARLERQKLAQVASLVERERPDVVSLLEVDRGSHRTATDGQVQRLLDTLEASGAEYAGTVANKYGEGRLHESLPFFGNLANAVLTRSTADVMADAHTPRTHYLSAGRKRLVLEVPVDPQTVVFAVHLSLGGRSRARQLAELATLLEERAEGRSVVVTGDFNTFDGTAELAPITGRLDLEPRVPGETVPARPLDGLLVESRSVDLFLTSPGVSVDRCEVLDLQISDHRPVVLETAT